MEACFQFVRCTTREGFLPLGLGGWSAPPLPAAVGATGLSMEPVYTAAAVTLEARQACLHAPHLAKDLAVIFIITGISQLTLLRLTEKNTEAQRGQRTCWAACTCWGKVRPGWF